LACQLQRRLANVYSVIRGGLRSFERPDGRTCVTTSQIQEPKRLDSLIDRQLENVTRHSLARGTKKGLNNRPLRSVTFNLWHRRQLQCLQ
jgi:hypothetical protein